MLARPSSAIFRRASADDGAPGAVLQASWSKKFFLNARGGLGSQPVKFPEDENGAPIVYEKVTLLALAPTEFPAGFLYGNLMDFIGNIFFWPFDSSLAPQTS